MPAFYAMHEHGRVAIEGDDARHLARSLRAKPGEEIEVLDLAGFMLTVRLDRVTPSRVEGTVISQRPHKPEPQARITIAVANLPAPALELVLSRCTEAGAYAFVVFQADRSVGRGGKLERWNTITREAAMLAGRLRIPEVSVASSADAAIAAEEFPVLLQRESPQRLANLTSPLDISLFIGPEGGWTERELNLGETSASLGPRNLRAETAALVGLAIALSVRGS